MLPTQIIKLKITIPIDIVLRAPSATPTILSKKIRLTNVFARMMRIRSTVKKAFRFNLGGSFWRMFFFIFLLIQDVPERPSSDLSGTSYSQQVYIKKIQRMVAATKPEKTGMKLRRPTSIADVPVIADTAMRDQGTTQPAPIQIMVI